MSDKPHPLAYVGAVALLAVAAWPDLISTTENGDTYTTTFKIGRALGSMVFGIVVGYFLWWLYRRSSDQPLAKWSPWVFVIAAGAALLTQF